MKSRALTESTPIIEIQAEKSFFPLQWSFKLCSMAKLMDGMEEFYRQISLVKGLVMVLQKEVHDVYFFYFLTIEIFGTCQHLAGSKTSFFQ